MDPIQKSVFRGTFPVLVACAGAAFLIVWLVLALVS